MATDHQPPVANPLVGAAMARRRLAGMSLEDKARAMRALRQKLAFNLNSMESQLLEDAASTYEKIIKYEGARKRLYDILQESDRQP